MKRYLTLSLILLAISGCASSTNVKSADVTPTPKIFQVDNLKSCQMWQKAVIEFLQLSDDGTEAGVSTYWAEGIKLKNAAQYGDSKLKRSLYTISKKWLGITEEDFSEGWNTTPEHDAANKYIIDFCETLDVYVR